MEGADAWYLYLEGPTMYLHVTGVLLLDPTTAPNGFSFAQLREFVSSRLEFMPALRRRLVEVPLAIDHPGWIEDPDFDIDNHLHERHLGDARTMDELTAYVGEFASVPLSRDRPLWDMVLVDHLEGGRAAVIAKMHHCIIDGGSGMDAMAYLLDLSPEAQDAPTPRPWSPDAAPSAVNVAASAAINRLKTPLRPARAAVGAAQSPGHPDS